MPKATKLRPYKVDYIDISEVRDNRVPVHHRLVRMPTAAEAKDFVARLSAVGNRIIVGARRFYKKLPKENLKPVAIETLFSGARATAVMKQVALLRASGPTSLATRKVLTDLAGMTTHDEHEQTMDTFVPDAPPPVKFSTILQAAAPEEQHAGCAQTQTFNPPPTDATPGAPPNRWGFPTFVGAVVFTFFVVLWLIQHYVH